MKILMLAPQPFFEPRGTPLSVLSRLKALSQLGHQVDLVTYHLGQDVSIPNVTVFRTPRIGLIKTVSIGPSMKKLFLDFLLLGRAVQMLQKSRYDLLHTHEEASFFGIFLARAFGVPHLYDMHSSLPEQLINFRYCQFRPVISLFERLERRVINSSDALITVCPALEQHARKINSQIPHVMIENIASENSSEDPLEEDLERFRATHRLNDRKIILYAGTLEPYQGIGLLLESAEHVVLHRQDVLFLVVGGKPNQVREYEGLVKNRGLARYFCFTGIRPHEEVPLAVKLSDILVSPRISGTNTPLKIYAYLRSGKPIVATNLRTHTQVLNANVSVLVEPEPEAMAGGILSVLENPLHGAQLGRRATQLFENYYSFTTFLQKTEKVLQMATG